MFFKRSEGGFGFARNGFGRLIAVGCDFEDAGRGGGQSGERRADGRPVDRTFARPEVLVLHVGGIAEGAVIVVQMDLRDARPHEFDGSAYAGVFGCSRGGH